MSEKRYRYELKFGLSPMDAQLLKQQLALVCDLDPHSVCDEYSYDIRSLYFDDAFGSAYQDKINGEMFRKKYRIRIYNMNTDIIKLECKHKDFNMTYKQESDISLSVCRHLVNGEYHMVKPQEGLLEQFLTDARLFGLRPAVIVDYRRLAFTYPVSQVRITFDENIRSGRYQNDFLKKSLPLYTTRIDDMVELEVKCDEYIPDHITALLSSVDSCRIALSKYALAYQIK